MNTRNMRKNVQINVGVNSDWVTPRTPKNNQQSVNLPNIEPRSSTGQRVPKIGIESLGLTPKALERRPSKDGRRGSKMVSQYENLYIPPNLRKGDTFERVGGLEVPFGKRATILKFDANSPESIREMEKRRNTIVMMQNKERQ